MKVTHHLSLLSRIQKTKKTFERPRRLDFTENENEEHEKEEYLYVSPLERKIEEAETELKQAQKTLDNTTARYSELQDKLTNCSDRDTSMNICGNCHFRAGHTKKLSLRKALP